MVGRLARELYNVKTAGVPTASSHASTPGAVHDVGIAGLHFSYEREKSLYRLHLPSHDAPVASAEMRVQDKWHRFCALYVLLRHCRPLHVQDNRQLSVSP